MKYLSMIVPGLFLAGLSACITPRAPLANIPLVWKPTSEVSVSTASLTTLFETKVQFETFKDTRKQPELIAENHEDATPKTVTTRDNVGQFVTLHVREAFDRMGLSTVDSGGDVVISGEVRQFFVEETTTYKGDVLLRLIVRSRGGKTLWSGAAPGVAKRFGRSYSAQNYYEVFSDSILDAVSSLLKDADFRRALARK